MHCCGCIRVQVSPTLRPSTSPVSPTLCMTHPLPTTPTTHHPLSTTRHPSHRQVPVTFAAMLVGAIMYLVVLGAGMLTIWMGLVWWLWKLVFSVHMMTIYPWYRALDTLFRFRRKRDDEAADQEGERSLWWRTPGECWEEGGKGQGGQRGGGSGERGEGEKGGYGEGTGSAGCGDARLVGAGRRDGGEKGEGVNRDRGGRGSACCGGWSWGRDESDW